MPLSSSKLIIFAKAPIAGTVKTRLQPQYSAQNAASLQEYFILKTVEVASNLKNIDIELRCAPNESHPVFQQCQRDYEIAIKPQQGVDLGERMKNALAEALTQYSQAVVIGTDCPEITSDYLNIAFSMLENSIDAVIGPALDGGYVLLGLRRFSPLLFENIRWGTEQVLSSTQQSLRLLNWNWTELNMLRDIDTPEDLAHFPEILRQTGLI
jgi:rSAM/selenodomain-associated transferase 1